MSKHDDLWSILLLSFYIIQVVALIAIGYLVFYQAMPLQYLAIMAVMFLIGTRYRALNNIVHECTHYSFCKSKKMNIFIGKIAANVIFTSYKDYKMEHMSHHKSLGDYENDLDFQSRQKFNFEASLTLGTVLRHIFTPILGLHYPQYFSVSFTFKDGFGFGMIKILMVMAVVVGLYFAPVASILMLILPFVWVFSGINYWTDCIDHAGLMHKDDDLLKSRNFILNPVIRSILFPRNDCYHLIHHLFPSVPAHHMENVHEILLGDASYFQVSDVEKYPTTWLESH
ncbi:MAG: fatty acid desaturase [Rhizobiales bacterium]|nr:fatty acid desaturase [Hyphomicrobiales bacterium]NRB15617.1 fatty acid desaturase [Hyphomicrobiales bacterium]